MNELTLGKKGIKSQPISQLKVEHENELLLKHFKAELRDPLDSSKETKVFSKKLDFKLNFNLRNHRITGIVDLIGGAIVEGFYRPDATKYFKFMIKSPNAHLHQVEGQILEKEFNKLDGFMYDLEERGQKKKGPGRRIIFTEV